jgi:hypothetical protein
MDSGAERKLKCLVKNIQPFLRTLLFMIRFFPGEEWKEMTLDYKPKFRYAISNYGRLASYTEEIQEGRLLKGSHIEGYRVFRYKIFTEKGVINRHLFLHKLVAEYFLEKKAEDEQYVLHLDHHKSNNHVSNLQWANKLEMTAHNKKSPAVIIAKKQLVEHNRKRAYKLNPAQVQLIKKKIFDPERKTRLKIIAKQFGITEMQLYRIKSGENWGHIATGLHVTEEKKEPEK